MKTYNTFFEELEARKVALRQKQKDQLSRFKQKRADTAAKNREKDQKARERAAQSSKESD